ncbi:MAG: NAD(P)/FAD-dependent oxidoreductase [Leptospiraceae bacterium]|nr:NAD(P)/FAD-dependent oxidoreductase [Leptospiraceae bacterium]MDW8306558.1 NAD(P)/FAD-dependent oxidoreductase [Leptospiraceae bacterium]
MKSQENFYDVILIGSGIGALACASILVQEKKKKVLVLEQHFKAGGFTHIFRRKQKYLFDVGVHYIGNLEEGTFLRKVFDYVTRKGVRFQKMPFVFEKFVYPDLTMALKSDWGEYQKDLVALFPQERKGLQSYFAAIKEAKRWFQSYLIKREKLLPTVLHLMLEMWDKLGKDWGQLTTQEVVDSLVLDLRLKAILLSQWGDYGLPPKKSSFVYHALVVDHYQNGGWYPEGGAGKIYEAIKPILQETQSAVLLNHKVEKIIVENGMAKGVLVTTRGENNIPEEKTFFAKQIISNVGLYGTYVTLLDDLKLEREKILDFTKRYPSMSALSLYVGFKEDPRRLGFLGENHWIYKSYDHNENYELANAFFEKEADPTVVYLSFPSLKDPLAESHTAEIIIPGMYDAFSPWKDKPWKQRGDDYALLKEKIAQRLLHYLDKIYPGFGQLVDFYELSTPITVEYFSKQHRGAIYGAACVPERLHNPLFAARTPIPNLFLTGADVLSPGVAGALLSSLFTYAAMEGVPALLMLLAKLR